MRFSLAGRDSQPALAGPDPWCNTFTKVSYQIDEVWEKVVKRVGKSKVSRAGERDGKSSTRDCFECSKKRVSYLPSEGINPSYYVSINEYLLYLLKARETRIFWTIFRGVGLLHFDWREKKRET